MAHTAIDSLRNLQASLNSAIDSYVADQDRSAAGREISSLTDQIINIVRDPFGEVVRLALQVNR
jgi:hypothetical protein